MSEKIRMTIIVDLKNFLIEEYIENHEGFFPIKLIEEAEKNDYSIIGDVLEIENYEILK